MALGLCYEVAWRTHTHTGVLYFCSVFGFLLHPFVHVLSVVRRVDLWNNGNLAQDVFLGETRVSIKILRNENIHKAW